VPGPIALGLATAVRLAFLLNGIFPFPMYLWPLQSNFWTAKAGQAAGRRRMEKDRCSYVLFSYATVAVCAATAAVLNDVEKPLKVLGATAVGYWAFFGPANPCAAPQ